MKKRESKKKHTHKDLIYCMSGVLLAKNDINSVILLHTETLKNVLFLISVIHFLTIFNHNAHLGYFN